MKGYWIAKVNVLHPDKQKMYEAFTKTQGVDLMKAFDQQTLNNPITDIVDSYFIMRAGFENSISNNI